MRNASIDFEVPTAMFSMEMSHEQIVQRLLSSQADLHQDVFKRPKLEPAEREALEGEAVQRLKDAPIFIDSTPSLTADEMMRRARHLCRESGVRLLIIDYLQLTECEDKRIPREQHIAGISRKLKQLSIELDISVIALSQLSRAAEARDSKQPRLTDLRESGAIEQDADIVLLLHGLSPEARDRATQIDVSCHVAKNRNGHISTAHFRVELSKGQFTAIEKEPKPVKSRKNTNSTSARLSKQEQDQHYAHQQAQQQALDEDVPFLTDSTMNEEQDLTQDEKREIMNAAIREANYHKRKQDALLFFYKLLLQDNVPKEMLPLMRAFLSAKSKHPKTSLRIFKEPLGEN